MKKSVIFIGIFLVSFLMAMSSEVATIKPTITKAEPLSWWTEMNCPLTLMLYGTNLKDGVVSINYWNGKKASKESAKGLVLKAQHNAESDNYLFLDLEVKKSGTYLITVTKDKKKTTWVYEIHERREGSRERLSFTNRDIMYLIMSDRFVDGDTTNNSVPSMREKANKANVHGRWGGDIAGIISQFGRLQRLGVTAIWPTPLLEDNEAAWSYHGYACSDYYHIDPRYGSNELYQAMVDTAHRHKIKVLMDMVPNHCGAAHWWMKDLPFRDWVNYPDTFIQTCNVFSANYDIHASQYDRDRNNRGWFDHPMPDMNLDNPYLLQYFTQWAIWWIEYADLDGLRVDTYPYIGRDAAAQWCKNIIDEYPNLNIVGECWTRPASNVAYWQDGANNFDGFNSNLPSVMDFPLEEAIRQALEGDGSEWGGGIMRIYDALAQDYLYADPDKLLIFVGNHDMDRFADVVKENSFARMQIGYTLLFTLRGIPQIFAGDEYGIRSSDRSLGHSTLRRPLPVRSDLTPEQKDLEDFIRHMLKLRRQNPVLISGKMMHFASRDNTYAYFRYNDSEAVMVYINASEKTKMLGMKPYAEMTSRYKMQATNLMTGIPVEMNRTDIDVPGLSVIMFKFEK